MSSPIVAVRLRPHNYREIKESPLVTVVEVTDSKTVIITDPKVPPRRAGDSRLRQRRFTFDYCFDATSCQRTVHTALSAEIRATLEVGRGACVLAYGQSASGKTHTVLGTETDPGLGPRLCTSLFSLLSGPEDNGVEISYLEIYNERVRDLLSTETENLKGAGLRVREHPQHGTYVQNLASRKAKTLNQLLSLIREGSSRRCTGSTLDNLKSSRSHAVLSLSPWTDTTSAATSAFGVVLRLVDLAGSERAARCAYRLQEGAHINRSLVALGNVVSALASSARFVPYRGSALTWLLRDSLGGQSKTIVIATLSPAAHCYGETVNTLRFAARAGKVQPRPRTGLHHLAAHDRTIRELRAEVQRLRDLLNRQVLGISPGATNRSPSTASLPTVVMESAQDVVLQDDHDAFSVVSEVHSNSPTSGCTTPKLTRMASIARKSSVESITEKNEKSRPPWKLVSTSPSPATTPPTGKRAESATLVKKDAKLRLLDATRRALCASRKVATTAASTQTEPEPCLRVRETFTEVPLPLDLERNAADACVATEPFSLGSPIVLKRSCGSNTETSVSDQACQTAVPVKQPISFTKYLQRKLSEDSLEDRVAYQNTPDLITARDTNLQMEAEFPDSSPELPRTSIGTTKPELTDLKELVLGRNPNMYPYNIPVGFDDPVNNNSNKDANDNNKNNKTKSKTKSVSFTQAQAVSVSVSGLIHEATTLMSNFNKMSFMLAERNELRGVDNCPTYNYINIEPVIPVSKWDKILTESCNDLERCVNKTITKTFTDLSFPVPNIDVEYFQY